MRVRMQQMATRAAYAKLRGAFAGWAHWALASAGDSSVQYSQQAKTWMVCLVGIQGAVMLWRGIKAG